MSVTLPPSRLNGHEAALNDQLAAESAKVRAEAGPSQPIFSPVELEQLNFRRFNPYANLTASALSSALDAYEAGEIATAARFWARIAKSDPTINTVKPKREEAVSLRKISTRPKDDSPLAADQAAFLKNFYDNVRASHATKRHVLGKSSLLLRQMMESRAYEYAVHHIIWQPNAAQLFTLPSGKKVPTLAATFEYVPLEYFEARTGTLRFLGLNNYINGEPLEKYGDWLITTGPGLMFCGSVLHYFARLARHDFVNYSEKFGTPGILVMTTAQQNSPEGKAALELANKLGSNYRGVLYGAPENKAEFLTPGSGPASTGLPMHVLTADIKQEIISMWMGADLSTQSRGQDIVGASVQGEEEDAKHRSDCMDMGDALNVAVDPLVLRWAFGTNTPILAEAYVDYPQIEDRAQLTQSVSMMVNAGAEVPIEPIAKRLDVPLRKDAKEKIFEKAVAPAESPDGSSTSTITSKSTSDKKTATNVAIADPNLEDLLGKAAAAYRQAFAGDMAPLRTALEGVLVEDDGIAFNSKLAWLQSQFPSLLREINASPKSAEALADILRASFQRGVEQAAASRSAAELAATTR